MKKIISLTLILIHSSSFCSVKKEQIVFNFLKILEERFGPNITNKEQYQHKNIGAQRVEILKNKNKKNFQHMKSPDSLGKGNSKVEALLQKNRKKIAKKYYQNKNSPFQSIQAWKKFEKKHYKKLNEGYKDFLLKNDENQKNIKKQISRLKSGLEDKIKFPPIPKKYLFQSLNKPPETPFVIVKNSLENPIKDQKYRPTCSAFAGAKAIEIALRNNGSSQSISTQYLYWSSKPNCKKTPCQKRGSFLGRALRYSRQSQSPDIPLEKDCPYNPVDKPDNQTQTPLQKTCQRGFVKVKEYNYLKTWQEAIESLKKNNPLVFSTKLTPNFYQTNGLVLKQDVKKNGKMNEHSKGHAMTAIGHITLPKKIWPSEGKFCLIVANSWGPIWGQNGYGCLSEKWLIQNRINSPIIEIVDIALK